MKFAVPILFATLLILSSLVASFLFEDDIELELESRARNAIASNDNLRQVAVEFRAFDAALSGEVSSPELRAEAEDIINSLPGARIATNQIRYPGYQEHDPGPPAPAPPAADPPKKKEARSFDLIARLRKKPATLSFHANQDQLTLEGCVPDAAVKASFLTAFAAVGRFPEIEARELLVDPKCARTHWPEALPQFTAFLLVRATKSDFFIDPKQVRLEATALDGPALEQIQARLIALDLDNRRLAVDIGIAPGLPTPQDEAFFLKSTLLDRGNPEILLEGRLASPEEKSRLLEILRFDLPRARILDEITVQPDLKTPDWAPRLPNLLSLLHTRTQSARLTALQERLHIVGEMRENEAPENLADLLTLMLGPQVTMESHLLPYEQTSLAALPGTSSASVGDTLPSRSPPRPAPTLSP